MINVTDINIITHSDVKWKPVNLKSNYNYFNINQQNITFTNGVEIVNSNIFANTKDVKINQDSIVMLSDTVPVSQIFNEQKKNISLKNELFYSALFIEDYNVTTSSTSFDKTQNTTTSSTLNYLNPPYKLRYLTFTKGKVGFTTSNNFSKTELFKFTFIDDYVVVSDLNNQFITSRTIIGRKDYIHATSKLPDSDFQKFNYILNDTSITLFKYNSNYTQLLTFNIYNNNIEYKNISNLYNIPDNATLYIDNFRDKINSASITDSFIVKYDINNLSSVNLLEKDSYIKNINYNQNYIINIPFINQEITYDAYITSLKNYQTPTYEYTVAGDVLSRRNYTNIFTGNFQKNGYDNIYLNYTSNTLEKVFKKDNETIFHYPATAPIIYLSAAGLVEDGAIAGKSPFSSDRINYSNRDYRDLNIPSVSAIITDNSWRCAWLSGDDLGNSVWMDRYYTGAYLLNTADVDAVLYNVNDPLIVDIPSTMSLLPNRVYSYFHQGQKNIKTYTDLFSNIERDNSTKILEITSWDSSSLVDSSIYNNNGLLVTNETIVFNTDYINLYSVNYILFPYTKSLLEDKELTVGLWYRVNDWDQSRGAQIFGNFADGGIGLFNIQKENTFNITFANTDNNNVYNYTENFALKSKNALLNNTSGPVYIIRMSNLNYWVIDSSKLTATNFDINNNKLNTIYFTDISQINQVETDIAENIYVVDSVRKKVIRFDGYEGGINKHISLPLFNSRIEIVYNYTGSMSPLMFDYQTNSTIIGVDGITSCTDLYNNIWYALGSNLYKNGPYMYASLYNIKEITASSDGHLWVLHDNKITKLNTQTDYFVFTKTIPDNIKNINFINILQNNIYTTYLIGVDSDSGIIYIIDEEGNIFNTIKTDKGITGYGDYTRYQHQRKFNLNNDFAWKVYVTESSGIGNTTSGSVYIMPFSVPVIDNEWHYYSFTFSSSQGCMSLYIDGTLHTENTFDKNTRQPFRYKIKQSSKPYTLGITTSKQGISNIRNIGSISRLHLYKYAFKAKDIKNLFNSTYIDFYRDLTWNINIGKRNYIEQIDKFFMHKMPGNKSKYFNIKIKNFSASNKQKNIIEQAIKEIIPKIMPADTTLNYIKWDN